MSQYAEKNAQVYELLRRFNGGDNEAGWKLVLTEQSLIQKLCKGYKHFASVDREELVNTFYLRIFNKLHTFDPSAGSFHEFVFYVLRDRATVCRRLAGLPVTRNLREVTRIELEDTPEPAEPMSWVASKLAELDDAAEHSRTTPEGIYSVVLRMRGLKNDDIRTLVNERYATSFNLKSIGALIHSTIAELRSVMEIEECNKNLAGNDKVDDNNIRIVLRVLLGTAESRQAYCETLKRDHGMDISYAHVRSLEARYQLVELRRRTESGESVDHLVEEILFEQAEAQQAKAELPEFVELTDEQMSSVEGLIPDTIKAKHRSQPKKALLRRKLSAIVYRAKYDVPRSKLAAIVPGDLWRLENALREAGVLNSIATL